MAFGLDTVTNFLQRFSVEIDNLGNLNQALGLLQGTAGAIFGLVSPMYGAIQATDEYNKSILNSQIAFSVATQEIDAFGNSVENFADRLSSSKKQFQQLEVDLEVETRTIVGLTSQRLSGILSEVVQESNTIFGQYTEKAGSSITDVFKNLTSNLAAAYSLLGSPVYQDPQETLALLQGNVTDPNSYVANKLNISKAEADEAQSQGRYIDLLIQKTQAYRTASTLASGSLENITSNLEDIQQISQREFGQPILQKFTEVGSQFFDSIVSTQMNAAQDIKVSTAKGVLSIDKDLEKNRERLISSTSDAEKESITDNINRLLKQRSDILDTSSEKLGGLGEKNPVDTLNNIIRSDLSFSGRDKIIQTEEDSFTLEKTGLDKIVGFAQELGDLFANILDKLSDVLAKIGDIFDNLNIGELLEGATAGFISGLSASLNTVADVLIGVLSVIETIIGGLKGLLDPILNIETGTFIGILAGVLASLSALGTVASGLSNGFLYLIKQASILATTFSVMSRREQARVLQGGAIQSFEGVVEGIRTNQNDLRNNAIRKSSARRAAARQGASPIGGFFRGIGDFFGAQADGFGARTRPVNGKSYGLNPFGTARRVMDVGVARAGKITAPGFTGLMAKAGTLLQAFVAALGSLLPLLLSAVAVVAIIVLGARALNKFVSNLALTEGPLRGIAEAARKLINSLDFLGKYFKGQKESLKRTDDKLTQELNQPLNKLQDIGGQEGYNRRLVGTDADYKEATDLQKQFYETYKKSNLILNGSEKELEAEGYSKEDIKNIKKLRKDQAETDQIKSLQDEISKTYENVFGQEISSEFKQVEQPYKGGFAEGLLSRLNKSVDYREKETSAGKGLNTVADDLDGISSAFETLNSQNLLGTDSLAIYAETFKLASQNEILGIEERNKFIALYNQAIDKEKELTERFLAAAEMLVKAKEKTGEIGQAESELEMARINVERAKADFVATGKKSGVNKSQIEESQKKLDSVSRLRQETTNKNISEVAPLFGELEKLRIAEKENNKLFAEIVPNISGQIKNIISSTTGTGREKQTKFNENFIEESREIFNSETIGKDISVKTKTKVNSYFKQIESIINGEFINTLDNTKKIVKGTTRSQGDRTFTDFNAIIDGFGGSGKLRLTEFVKANKEQLEKTATYTDIIENISGKGSEATKNAFKAFIESGEVDLKKLSPDVDKEKFVMAVRSAIEEIKNNKKNLVINLSPLFDNSDIKSQIDNLEKRISELSGQIIIEFDENYATKKLKELRAEREKIGQKIVSGDSTSGDITKAKSIDRQIDAEENRINRIILKDRAKSLKEEIGTLEKKDKLTPEEQKSLDNAKAKLKIIEDTDKILANRQKLSTEYDSKQKKLDEINKKYNAEAKKEKPDESIMKKYEGEADTISKRLAEINKQLVIDRFSQLETAEASVKGNEELSKLSTEELIAKNREVISAEKLYEVEKLVTEEKKQQERLAISITRASLEVAKVQNRVSGSFTPELFETEIGEKKINEIKEQLETARISVVENSKKINEAYSSIGSDSIKITLSNINQLGPEAFKKEIENLSQRTFKDSEEALKFAEKSVNIGVNADRILNADSITQEVKDAYKFIYGKDIDPNINLKDLQNRILNTKGGLTTDNFNARVIGGIKSDLETNQLTLPEAIKKAQSLGIKGIDENISKEKLIDTLTIEYGKSLKSDELIKNLDAREQSLIKVQQLESSIKDAVKSQIDALIQLANEEEKRFNRLERIKTLIDTFGTEGISDSEAGFRNASLDFKEAYTNLQNTELYKNLEKMYQLLGKTSGVTLADLQKLNSRGGLSEQDSNTLEAVLESMKKLTEIAEQRIASVLDKRLKVLELLNIASDIGLGPQAGLLPEERNVLRTTMQLENSILQLKSTFELQKIEDKFANKESLNEIDVTDSGTIDSLTNVFNAAREALNSFTELSLRRIGDISQKLSQQISIIGSLQSAYQSISQASEIYNSIANKVASKQMDYLSQRLQELNQPNEQDEKIKQQIEEIKKKGANKFGGNDFGEERKIADLEKQLSKGTGEKERIEYKIFQLKEKQLEMENLQAEIALRRQATENKIAQLKNKQARLELFSERAKIMALEDPIKRAFELNINDRLLGINKLESSLLVTGGERIQSSIKLQRGLNTGNLEDVRNEYRASKMGDETFKKSASSGFDNAIASLTNSLNFTKEDLENQEKVDKQVDNLRNNIGPEASDSNILGILAEAQKNRENVRKTLLDSLPKDVFDKLSKETKRDINQDIKNIIVSVTDAIKGTGIDSNLKAIEKNTRAIAEKVSKDILAGLYNPKPNTNQGAKDSEGEGVKTQNKKKSPQITPPKGKETPTTTATPEPQKKTAKVIINKDGTLDKNNQEKLEKIMMAVIAESLKVSGKDINNIPKNLLPTIRASNFGNAGGTFGEYSENRIGISDKIIDDLLAGDKDALMTLIHEVRHWKQYIGANTGNLRIDSLPEGEYKDQRNRIFNANPDYKTYKEEDAAAFAGLFYNRITALLDKNLFYGNNYQISTSGSTTANSAEAERKRRNTSVNKDIDGNEDNLESFNLPVARDSQFTEEPYDISGISTSIKKLSNKIITTIDNITDTFTNLPTVSGISSKDIKIVNSISDTLRSRTEANLVKDMFGGKTNKPSSPLREEQRRLEDNNNNNNSSGFERELLNEIKGLNNKQIIPFPTETNPGVTTNFSLDEARKIFANQTNPSNSNDSPKIVETKVVTEKTETNNITKIHEKNTIEIAPGRNSDRNNDEKSTSGNIGELNTVARLILDAVVKIGSNTSNSNPTVNNTTINNVVQSSNTTGNPQPNNEAVAWNNSVTTDPEIITKKNMERLA